MEKLTAQQIIERLAGTHLTVDNFAHEVRSWFPEDRIAYDELRKTHKWDAPEVTQLNKVAHLRADKFFGDLVGEWKEIAQHGGEGEGENWYSVKYFPDHDVYLKVSGQYYSYDGTHFDGWDKVKEVKPQEKTITVYE